MNKKIAVITPYYNESVEVLRKCYESVLGQKITADHFFIADGYANDDIKNWSIKHIALPKSSSNNGDVPRGIASLFAKSEGYDFIAYLDADNWYHPEHLSSLLELWERTGADICTSFRTMHSLNGDEMIGYQDADEKTLHHVDTSCFMIHRKAFDILNVWLELPKKLAPIGDRIFLAAINNKKYKIVSTQLKTVAFRTNYKSHYLLSGLAPPQNAKGNVLDEPFEWLYSLHGLKETYSRLGFVPNKLYGCKFFLRRLNHLLFRKKR